MSNLSVKPLNKDALDAAIRAYHKTSLDMDYGTLKAAISAYLSCLQEPGEPVAYLRRIGGFDDEGDKPTYTVCYGGAPGSFPVYTAPPTQDSVAGWQDISSAPKGELIDIWIDHGDGTGVRWCDCYYDRICDEWRTSRPSGRLLTIKAKHVTHWQPLPAAPLSNREG